MYNLVFFGTSSIAIPALHKLVARKDSFTLSLIVTTPNKSKYNINEIEKIAKDNNIEVIAPDSLNSEDIISKIKATEADLGIVASYGKIIPQNLIDIFPHGILNIHPSLLPLYRGPSPIQYAILDRASKTGVSIMKIDSKMDHGPILLQESISIDLADDYIGLEQKLGQRGAELLENTIAPYIQGGLIPTPQDDTLATFTKLIRDEDAKILQNDSLDVAFAKIKAFTQNPGAYIVTNGQRIKIYRADIMSHQKQEESTIISRSGLPILQLSDGELELQEIQIPGSKRMSGKDFVSGHNRLLPLNLE
jgi:methionyl-tRNA formyltransferase